MSQLPPGLKIIPPHFPYLRVVWGDRSIGSAPSSSVEGLRARSSPLLFGGRAEVWGCVLEEVYSLKEAPRAA